MPSPPPKKEIWLPSSTMNVRVQEKTITIWEDMVMERKSLRPEKTGFAKDDHAVDDPRA